LEFFPPVQLFTFVIGAIVGLELRGGRLPQMSVTATIVWPHYCKSAVAFWMRKNSPQR
jgi:hypothetical protein